MPTCDKCQQEIKGRTFVWSMPPGFNDLILCEPCYDYLSEQLIRAEHNDECQR